MYKYTLGIIFLSLFLMQACFAATNLSRTNALLLEAAFLDNNEKVIKALDDGADVNVRDAGGRTALAWSVANLNLKLIKDIVSRGGDLHYEGNGKSNLLHLALSSRVSMPPVKNKQLQPVGSLSQRRAVVEYLLQMKVKLDKPDEYGALPIHYAAALKGDVSERLKLLSLLMTYKQGVIHKNRFGFTPIDIAENPQVKSWLKLQLQ